MDRPTQSPLRRLLRAALYALSLLALQAAAVLAILLMVSPWPLRVGWLGPHPQSDTRIQMAKMGEALTVYAAKHHGELPERLDDAKKYFPDGKVPTDAWGNPFVYVVVKEPYVILSLGADGKPGGEGADQDILSSRRWD